MLEVDGDRALELATGLAAIAPRLSGTPGAKKAADWIAAQARQAGYKPEVVEWQERTPLGEVTFRNVYAHLAGKQEGFVVVGSHWDGKLLDDVPVFVGANDGGSSTGLLLEIMRVLKENEPWRGPDLWFAFFDGEECVHTYTDGDGLHGSKKMVADLTAAGRVDDCRAMVLMDMVGDRDLKLTIPRDNDPHLMRLVLDIAREQGVEKHVGYYVHGSIVDDHKPFADAGIPAVDLIDFAFGPNNTYWHTAEDTPNKLSARSLTIVGNLVLELLARL